MKIVELVAGSTSSTNQFIWCGNLRREQRDGAGALARQFFPQGETIGTSGYTFNRDHLGSIREMTNSAGSIVWQQSYDPHGVPSTVVSTTPADLGYAGYYVHPRSGLNLTRTRAYSAAMGRFINRDPLGLPGGINTYSYSANNPIKAIDPLGLSPLSLVDKAATGASLIIESGAPAGFGGLAGIGLLATGVVIIGGLVIYLASPNPLPDLSSLKLLPKGYGAQCRRHCAQLAKEIQDEFAEEYRQARPIDQRRFDNQVEKLQNDCIDTCNKRTTPPPPSAILPTPPYTPPTEIPSIIGPPDPDDDSKMC